MAGADRASAPVLARAKSAGAAYRLWRLQNRVDFDVCSGGLSVASGDGCSSDLSRAYARLLAAEGEDAQRLVAEVDDSAVVRRILDDDAAQAAVDLNEMGVSANRIKTLVRQDIDLKKHREGLRIYRMADKNVRQEGDVAEIIAHEKIILRNHPEARVYPKGQGLGVEIKGGPGEFDHVVVDRNGMVVKIYETKTGTDNAKKGLKDTRDNIGTIEDGEYRKISYGLEQDQFDSDTIEIDVIGPKDGESAYDITLSFTNDELHALYTTLTEDL